VEEYEKLSKYDGEIIEQLEKGATSLFLCHQHNMLFVPDGSGATAQKSYWQCAFMRNAWSLNPTVIKQTCPCSLAVQRLQLME
jgi:hypothetical protein